MRAFTEQSTAHHAWDGTRMKAFCSMSIGNFHYHVSQCCTVSHLEAVSEFHYLANLIWQNWDLNNASIFNTWKNRKCCLLLSVEKRLIALRLEAQVIPE